MLVAKKTGNNEMFGTLPIIVVEVKLLSRVRLFATASTVTRQAPLSMEFSRQEYWSGLPCPPPGRNAGKESLKRYMCMHAKSLQLCPTVCDPMDCV